MAVGIELYRNKKYDCFKGSEEIAAFTKTMNEMYDVSQNGVLSHFCARAKTI